MQLFVSDLDGTLLNTDREISVYSKNELNKLIDRGVNFTIATARTPATVVDILEGLNLKLPITLMNGVLIYNVNARKYIDIKEIEKHLVEDIINIFEEFNKQVFIYAIKNNHLFVYHKELINKYEQKYFDERCNKSLKTFVKVDNYKDALKDSKVINFVILDDFNRVNKIHDKVSNIKGLIAEYHKDIYGEGHYFYEVYSDKASKANGVKYLQRYVDSKEIISFGDNLNDIPMFEISTECYAMGNAVEKLKGIATATIGDNNSDSVAIFIKDRILKK
ncbi:HAD family hydrolase [Clostridium gasigenes]|uniref:HAD family hydrolase n=1 Tax=Clostridium gasigenes TaxID=94869 RepID=UPI001C0CAF77|nr:HAD family hydrolase [Clostridium gasigenes]MBU3131358.1 HAD family hydrolase [Clostridium gasigenes]